MTFQSDTDRERRRKPGTDDGDAADGGAAANPRRKKGQSAEVGDALRTVYQRAVAEDIPPEMLDLLGKLD